MNARVNGLGCALLAASLWMANMAAPALAADPAASVTVAGDVRRSLVVDADALRAYAPDAQVTLSLGARD